MPAIKHDDVLLRLIRDVNEVRSALRRVVATLPLYDIDNENSPAQITANKNNYIPGNFDVIRLTSSAAYSITGIANGVKGRKLRIFNVGAYPITLVHASASSLAINRFNFVNASDFIIPPFGNVLLYYDSTQQRWVGGDSASIYDVVNETTPAQITSNQNNYDPGVAEVLRLSTDAARTITGIGGGVKGRKLQIFNVGSYAITLAYESASSTAANRFKFAVLSNVVILPGSSISIYYNSTQTRWIEGTQLEDSGIQKEATPAQITSNQNNYDPSDYNVLRLSTDAARTITGISGGVKGRLLQIFNVGNYPITLSYESGSSAAANRFKFSNGLFAIIPPNGNIKIYYDSTQARWVGGDTLSNGVIFALATNPNSQSIPDSSATKIDPGSVVSDTYGIYVDASDKFEIIFDGVYNIIFHGNWDDADPTGDHIRGLFINVDGVTSGNSSISNIANQNSSHECSYCNFFVVGQDIEFYVYQESGGNLDLLSCSAFIQKIG